MSAMMTGRPEKGRERSHVCNKQLTHTYTVIVYVQTDISWFQSTNLLVCFLVPWWWQTKAGQQPLTEVREEVSVCEAVGGGVVAGQEL